MGEQSRRVERRAGHLGVDSHVEGYMELATVQNSTLTYTHTLPPLYFNMNGL